MANKIVIVWLCLMAFSCSPEKRLQRLIRKHPELVKIDTIFISDTTIIKEVKADTSVKLIQFLKGDTITLIKERLLIKTYYNRHDSIIVTEGTCKADTIIKEVPVVVNSVTAKIDYLEKYKTWLMLLLAVLIIILLLRKK
jgi:hypothetical protein